jgi:MFS family permease
VIKRLGNLLPSGYPTQMWVLFWGTLISIMGQSLIWPFLTIYIRQQLGVPLTQVTLLFTAQSLGTIAATAVIAPLVDRIGRKWIMVLGPLLSAGVQIMMIGANSYLTWGVLLVLQASAGLCFSLGSQAMIADVVPPEQRTEAYALMRMASNTGIAVGPAVGGFIIGLSYAISFAIAATVQVGLALTAFFLLVELASSLVFTLLAVYVKEQYRIPENQYGFIIGTNAAMVVLFQYMVTRFTRRYPPLNVMALGTLFYAGSMAIFAAGQAFWGFWLGIVVMTLGELLVMPTSSALVAALAPPHMRGRYMGIYGLSYRVAGGVAPVAGGWLSDNVFPAASWLFGMVAALLSAVGFAWLKRHDAAQRPAPADSPDPAQVNV